MTNQISKYLEVLHFMIKKLFYYNEYLEVEVVS